MRARLFHPVTLVSLLLAGCGDGGETARTVKVRGHVAFDDQSPVAGATVEVGGYHATELGALRTTWRAAKTQSSPRAKTLRAAGALGPLQAAIAPAEGTTDAQGDFALELEVDALPIRIRTRVRLPSAAGAPELENARWSDAATDVLDVGTIMLPSLNGAEIALDNGNGGTEDRTLQVTGMGPEVSRLFGRVYDPDEDLAAFPGELRELGLIPLNSAGFLWMEALDAAGAPVTQLSQAAVIRARVPRTQWVDLEDIANGTDRIEVPIYTFNETAYVWVQEPQVGWLEDDAGTVLPEDAEPVILDGSFARDVYAVFNTGHLSWMNVDYPSVGPWTLSRLDPAKRNDDCLYDAMKLATAIVRSAQGRAAYSKLNKPGGDLSVELADAAGPEVKSANLEDAFGEFKGNEQGDRDDQLYLDNSLWEGCAEGATEEQKKNTTLLIADTLVHETGHWKWDVKHDDGNWTNPEPTGEAGNSLEIDLFGGVLNGDRNGVSRNGAAVDGPTRDGWLDPATWPTGQPLIATTRARGQVAALMTMELSFEKTTFELGEEIPAAVKLTASGGAEIRVLDLMALEGYPLWFELVREGESQRVPFRGVRAKRHVDYAADFVTLQPGESITRHVALLRDSETGTRHYNLVRSGEYRVTAFYSGAWGLAETRSNTADITVGAGGAVAGIITDATNGGPLAAARVSAIQGMDVIATADSGTDGSYTIPELPAGTYVFEARAPGYLRNRVEGVTVVAQQTTNLSFSLSPLLAAGQIRLVLSWGESPSDLDSHLWLPAASPFHLYFRRRGALEACPFASLDTDDTNSFGPETITVTDFSSGTYTYAIFNYSASPDLTMSGARVQVFDSGGMIATYAVPMQGSGRWWKVLTIDGDSKAITEVNELADEAEPYADTDLACMGN